MGRSATDRSVAMVAVRVPSAPEMAPWPLPRGSMADPPLRPPRSTAATACALVMCRHVLRHRRVVGSNTRSRRPGQIPLPPPPPPPPPVAPPPAPPCHTIEHPRRNAAPYVSEFMRSARSRWLATTAVRDPSTTTAGDAGASGACTTTTVDCRSTVANVLEGWGTNADSRRGWDCEAAPPPLPPVSPPLPLPPPPPSPPSRVAGTGKARNAARATTASGDIAMTLLVMASSTSTLPTACRLVVYTSCGASIPAPSRASTPPPTGSPQPPPPPPPPRGVRPMNLRWRGGRCRATALASHTSRSCAVTRVLDRSSDPLAVANTSRRAVSVATPSPAAAADAAPMRGVGRTGCMASPTTPGVCAVLVCGTGSRVSDTCTVAMATLNAVGVTGPCPA